MIIALQNSLQKHHRVLLGALLVIMIGSFVFAGFLSDRSPGDIKLAHRGVNLTDARTTRSAREACSVVMLLSGAGLVTPDQLLNEAVSAAYTQKNGGTVQSEAFHQYTVFVDEIGRADALGVPTPDAETTKKFVLESSFFADRATGKFSSATFQNFTTLCRDQMQIEEKRLSAVLGTLWRLQKLNELAAPARAPGLDVLAARIVARTHTAWNVETAVFERAGFKPVVPQDEAAIAAYFETNKERYRTPEKLSLRVAIIEGDKAAAEKLAAPAVDSDELKQVEQNFSDKLPPYKGGDFGEYMQKTRNPALIALWRETKAGEIAQSRIADKLVDALPFGGVRQDSAKIETALKGVGFTTFKNLPAYGRDKLPEGTGVPDVILKLGLDLNAAKWRTTAIPYGDKVYLLVFDTVTPSVLPTLAEARARVVADRDGEEGDRRYDEAASAKAAAVAEAVKAGKKFAEAASAAGLKPAPAISFETLKAPQNLAVHIQGLETIPVGGVSGALREGENRFVAHILSRVTPDAAKDKSEVDTISAKVGAIAARTTAAPAAE